MNFLTTATQHMHTKVQHLETDDKWREMELEKYKTMPSHATLQLNSKKTETKTSLEMHFLFCDL